MQVDDIFSYDRLVAEERANLQKGMNFGLGGSYSVSLMSVRRGAPYSDRWDKKTGTLIYEGHEINSVYNGPDPKSVDWLMTTPSGSWTENGKFFRASTEFKEGLRNKPEIVKVYERTARGIWCYKGFFELLSAKIVSDGRRKVSKFYLKPVDKKPLGRIVELPHPRLIPTLVKVEV